MRISFVIPAYNEEVRIGACVDSIRAEIARSHADAEIIVVDNASTDGTRTAAEAAGARVVHEQRKGITWARQAGYLAASGELIANIDADVHVPPGWIDTVLARFQADQQLVALSGPFVYDDLSLFARAIVRIFYAIGYAISRSNRMIFGTGAMLQGGNFVVRRDALARAGGFNTRIDFYGEDTDIARRMDMQGRVVWTFALWVYTSGRRIKEEGLVRTGLRYAINYFSVSFAGTPATQTHADIRSH